MKRLLALLVATLATWLGAGVPASAIAIPTNVQCAPVYDYDGGFISTTSTSATCERAPPASYDRDTTHKALDRWADGDLVRLVAAASPTVTTYDHPAPLVQVATVAPTAERLAGVAPADLSSLARSKVAANARRTADNINDLTSDSTTAKYGDDAIEGIGDASSYINLTKGGSIRNVGTNTTHTEFAETLTSGGWISRTSKDGAVQIFQRDGAKYVLRSKNSSGYAGWTTDFTPAGSTRHTLEIRLGYVP